MLQLRVADTAAPAHSHSQGGILGGIQLVNRDIFPAKMWENTKLAGRWCPGHEMRATGASSLRTHFSPDDESANDVYTFSNLSAAVQQCFQMRHCAAIYDQGCNGQRGFKLCAAGTFQNSSISCLYPKPGGPHPAAALPHTRPRPCPAP